MKRDPLLWKRGCCPWSSLLKYLSSILLIGQLGLFAQTGGRIPPIPGDPQVIACSGRNDNDSGMNALEAWGRGKEFSSIEGDAVFGLANLGHTRESLEWYCKASAAGNAIAAYEIGKIFQHGYIVNTVGSDGSYITTEYLPDHATAFFWYSLAAERHFTRAKIALAEYYALGNEMPGGKISKDTKNALKLLNEAAEEEDTEALLTLAGRYYGLQMVRWVMELPIPLDKAKARDLADKIVGKLDQYTPQCNDKDILNDVKDIVPFDLDDRQVLGGIALGIHVSKSGPLQLECALSLSRSRPQKDESYMDRLRRGFRDDFTNFWAFSITQIPGVKEMLITRQTRTEGITERAEAMTFILRSIVSASSATTQPAPPVEPRTSPAPPEPPRVPSPPLVPFSAPGLSLTRLEQRANRIVLSMASGNFKTVTDDYTWGLTQFVMNRRRMPTPSALGSTWQGVVGHLGPFERIETIHEEKGHIPELVLVVAKLRNGNVNIEIVFGPEPARKTCNLKLQLAPSRTWPQGSATNCL